jgi:hypothetical protein
MSAIYTTHEKSTHAARRWATDAGVVINASLVLIAIMQKGDDYTATMLSI